MGNMTPKEERDALKGLKPIVERCARKLARYGLDHEDLVQEGTIGALRAIRTFDATKVGGCDLPGYAWLLALRAMFSAIGRGAAADGKQKVKRRPILASLDQPIGDSDTTFLDRLVSAEESPETSAIRSEEKRRVGAAVDALDERTARIVRGRMGGQTLEQVGEDIGLTRERVRQIEHDAHQTLRRTLQLVAA